MTDPDYTHIPEPAHAPRLPEPPPPGARLGDVIRYYTETAAALVPGWDLELIPLSGKNPRINGDGWQTLASSDPRVVLDQTVAAGRANGFGALMNRHIAFDVDHPEYLPPGLGQILREGLQSSTRPGRTHYIFRVPAGTRFGGSQAAISSSFGVLGKWGEIKGWNSQIRIWSPNDDGTHVALVPGEIPELPLVLVKLLRPPLAEGEIATIGELDDWLEEHTEARHMAWLGKDIDKLHVRMAGSSKYEAMNSTVFDMAGSISAGAYPGRQAYDGLLEEYRDLCEADRDWDGERLPKYQDSWRGAVAKWTRDPGLIRSAEEKRLKYGADVAWDPAHDEGDLMVLEILNRMRVHSGLEPLMEELIPPEITDEEIRELMDAAEPSGTEEAGPETRSEDPDVPDDSGIHQAEPGEPERDEEPEWTPRMESDEPVQVVDDHEAFLAALRERKQAEITKGLIDMGVKEIYQNDYRKMKTGAGDLDWKPLDLDNIDPEVPPILMPVSGCYPEPGTVAPELASTVLGLMYDDGLMNLIGDKASGKSWMMAAEAVRYLSAGGTVAWLDWEMTHSRLSRRLVNVGASQSMMAGFKYMQMAGSTVDDVRGKLSRLPRGTMVVIDSVARALASEGGSGEADENSAAFYNSWLARVSGLKAMGLCLALIEHTGHTNQHRGRGSSAKGQGVDSEASVHVVEPWSRSAAGWAAITSRKDRGGFHPADEPRFGAFYTPLGGGDLGIELRMLNDWEVTMAKVAMMDTGDRARFEKEAALETRGRDMEAAILDALADGSSMSKVAIGAAVGVSRKVVVPVIEGLIAAGKVVPTGPPRGPGAGIRLA